MNPHYTYLLIDAGSVVVPLAFSFGPKIAFYRQWKYLWLPLLLTATIFISWDIAFTRMGVWSFSEKYTLPLRLFSLPPEEWLFFFAIPYSCVFIYSSLKVLLPRQAAPGKGWGIGGAIALALIIVAAVFYKRAYTCTAFGGCGLAILVGYVMRRRVPSFSFGRFLLTYFVCLLPFFVVNGLLTSIPVVRYNDFENIHIRLWFIPLEDVFYGMLLIFGCVWGLEANKTISTK